MNCACGGICSTHTYLTRAGIMDVWRCKGCGREVRKLNGKEIAAEQFDIMLKTLEPVDITPA